jgi:hypothetical protein
MAHSWGVSRTTWIMIHGTHERLFKLNQSENFQEHYQVTQGDQSEWYGNRVEILDSK